MGSRGPAGAATPSTGAMVAPGYDDDDDDSLSAQLPSDALDGLFDSIVAAAPPQPTEGLQQSRRQPPPAQQQLVFGSGIRRPLPSYRSKRPTEPISASMGPPPATKKTLPVRGPASAGVSAAACSACSAAAGGAAAVAEIARAEAAAADARPKAKRTADPLHAADMSESHQPDAPPASPPAAALPPAGLAAEAVSARRPSLVRALTRSGSLLCSSSEGLGSSDNDERMRETVQVARARARLSEELAAQLRVALLGLVDDGSMDWQTEWDEVLTRHRNLNARREEAIVTSRSSLALQRPASAAAHDGSGGEGGCEVRAAQIDIGLLDKGGGGEDGASIDKTFATSIRGMVDDLVTQAHTAKRSLRERRRPAGEGLTPHPHASASASKLGGGFSAGGRRVLAGGGLHGMGEYGTGENGASEIHVLGNYAHGSHSPLCEGEGERPSSSTATRRLARPASAAAILPTSQLAGKQQRAGGVPPWLKGAGADWLPRFGNPRYAPDAPS